MFSRSFLPYLKEVINHSIATSFFTDELKLTEVMSAFKTYDSLENYRPITLHLIPQNYVKKYFSAKSMTT